MFIAKIIGGNWEEGTLALGDMPEDFVLSARKVKVLELDESPDLEALCRSLSGALKDWQQFDTESGDKHPCPDPILRAAYRNRARATTDVALTEYKNLLGE